MARIHLTGAGGYIGATLLERLLAAGHEVQAAGYRLPEIEPLSINADVVVHLAAAGGGTVHRKRPGWEDEADMERVNVLGMRTLLDGLAHPDTRLIFISSTAVYGKFLPSPRLDESASLRPVSAYGRNKAAAEAVLAASSVDWLVLRPSGVFGLGAGGQFGNSFLNVAVMRALDEARLELFGGDQEIDCVFIDDVVEVVRRACGGEWRSSGVYNVAGEIVSVERMMHELHEVLDAEGHSCGMARLPWTPVPGVFAETGRLRRDFPGWRPTPLPEALRRLVRAHIRGWQAVAG